MKTTPTFENEFETMEGEPIPDMLIPQAEQQSGNLQLLETLDSEQPAPLDQPPAPDIVPAKSPLEELLSTYRKQMEAAQKRRDDLNLAATLAEIGTGVSNAVSQAYSGRKIAESSPAAAFLRKQGELAISDAQRPLEDKIAEEKIAGIERKSQEEQLRLNALGEETDPTSQSSKIMQDLAKRLMPGINYEGLSATQIQKLFPQLTSAYNAEQNRILKAAVVQDPLDLFKERENVKEDKTIKKENRKIRQDLDKAVPALEATKTQLEDLKKALKQFDKDAYFSTGPFLGQLNRFTKAGQLLDAKIKAVNLDKMIKMFANLSRAVDSESDRKAFEAAQASLSNYSETNEAIINDAIKAAENMLRKTKEAASMYDRDGSFTTRVDDAYLKEKDDKADFVRMKNPETGEVLEVNKNDVADAEKDGFRRI